MNIKYVGISDIGLKRTVNQDSIFMGNDKEEKIFLFVVADGMGGHINGELASQTITKGLQDWLEGFSEEVFEKNFCRIMIAIRKKLEEINLFIYHEYNQEETCGSTCVILIIYNGIFGVISVGDSHIYLHRGIHTKILTEDDVWENQKSIRESLSKKTIQAHPKYGKLIHAIGTTEVLSVSTKTDMLKHADTFLLCSDGLYKYYSERKLKHVLHKIKTRNLEKEMNQMIQYVYKNGAKDNISVIIVKCKNINKLDKFETHFSRLQY